jgi:hypothetical protein
VTYPSIRHHCPDGYAALYPSCTTSTHPYTVGRVKEQREVPVTPQLHKRPSRIQCAPTPIDTPVINLLQQQIASAISAPIPDGYATLYTSCKTSTHPYSVGRVKEQRDVPVTTQLHKRPSRIQCAVAIFHETAAADRVRDFGANP